MKLTTYVCAVLMMLFSSCEKDNFKEPASKLTGRVVYQQQPIGVRSMGVQFELWQPGYQLFTRIPLNIAQDGSFSAELFDGDYKLVRSKGAGPWTDNSDTINVSLKGSVSVDVPVEPYFIIKNASFEKNGTAIKATFTIDKNPATTKTVELARLYLGSNLILDQNNNAGNIDVKAVGITLGQAVTLNLTIPGSISNESYIFARVGVKTNTVAELLYTPSQKIQLK